MKMPRKPMVSKQKLAFIVERTPDLKTYKIVAINLSNDLRVLKNKMADILNEIEDGNQLSGFIQSTDWYSKNDLESLKKRKKKT
jgi:hypothetical protein